METKNIDLIKQAIEKNGVVTRGSILEIVSRRMNCSKQFLDLTFITKSNTRVMINLERKGCYYIFPS